MKDPYSPSVGSQARRFCESKDSVSATDAFALAPSMGSAGLHVDVKPRKPYPHKGCLEDSPHRGGDAQRAKGVFNS